MNLFNIEMCLSFVAIVLGVIAFYGIDNTNWNYFEKGRFVTNTEGWRYRYQGVVYPLGLMVSEPAAIAVVSTVGILISWLVHEALRPYIHCLHLRLEKEKK